MYEMNSNELYHFGVLGMKWGIRRGRTNSTYAKASVKLTKLDKKAEKKQNKALKKMNKADRKQTSLFSTNESRSKATAKAARAQAKANRAAYKAQKWYKSMEKEFAKVPMKLSSDQIAIGKKYEEQLKRNANTRYIKYYY